MGKGPERGARLVVDRAVAVRADQGHVTYGFNQCGFQRSPGLARLAEARRVADDAARPHGSQVARNLDCGGCGHGQEDRVRRLGQVGQRPETGVAAHLVPTRVDRPDRSLKPAPFGFADGGQAVTPADEGDMARRQQASQIVAPRGPHAPSGLRIDRLMMWRWISEVPSQIRSSRASRHRR